MLDIKTFRRLMAELEELECIRAYDAAKASGEVPVSFEQAVPHAQKGPNNVLKPTLEQLLAKVTDENLHREVDFGPALGNEAW